MNYIPRIEIAKCSLHCSSLRKDTILGGQEYVKLGAKHFCLDCAGERLVKMARQRTLKEV